MGVRLVEVSSKAQSQAVAALIATATLDRSCMVLAFRAPASVLLRQMDAIGGDPEHVFILDAVDQNPMSSGREGNVMGGFNPGMLERVLLRAKQIIDREKERELTLVVDGLDEVLAVNPPAAVIEILMRMREELLDESAQLEWIHRPGLDSGFMELVVPLVDSKVHIGE